MPVAKTRETGIRLYRDQIEKLDLIKQLLRGHKDRSTLNGQNDRRIHRSPTLQIQSGYGRLMANKIPKNVRFRQEQVEELQALQTKKTDFLSLVRQAVDQFLEQVARIAESNETFTNPVSSPPVTYSGNHRKLHKK